MQQRLSVAFHSATDLLLRKKSIRLITCLLLIGCILASLMITVFVKTSFKVHASPQGLDDLSSPPAIGINVGGSIDSDPEFVWADAFKTYRLLAPDGQSNPPSLDVDGQPQGDFTALLWDGAYLHHTNGTYALRFNGKADLNFTGVSATISNQYYDPGSNTTTATVDMADGTPYLHFTNTQRTNDSATNTGVTNMQLMLPTYPGSGSSYSFGTTFTDQYKALISKFQVIRFMDYMATNSNGQVNWSDRRLPQEDQEGPIHNSNSYGWEGLGGAWEYTIQLCNETNRDCYINIPEQATGNNTYDSSSYIYQLALLFKYGSDEHGNVYTSYQSNPVHAPLNSNLHLYIEYSNEVWNTGGGINFAQAGQNHDAAKAEVQAGGSPLNYDGETSDWTWTWRRQAKRIKETSEIFRAVFGDGAMMSQVRPLLEWQYGNGQGTAAAELTFLNNYYNNADGYHVSDPHSPTYYVWGGGGATYSGVKNPNASTIDDIYNSGFDGDNFKANVTADANYAKAFGLRYVSYEGGFSVGGDNPGDLQKQANLDPRAKDLEKQTQSIFSQAGGDLLMYFNSAGYTAYGMADPDIFSQDTPKLQAISDISQNSQAAPTNGTAIPATIAANQWSLTSRGWGNPGGGSLGSFGTKADPYGTPAISWASYNLTTTSSGNYTITVAYTSSVSGSFQVLLGDTVLGTVSVSDTGGSSQSSASFSFTAPAGVSAIRLQAGANSDNFTIDSLTIS